ncbi:hypothetical protein [Propionispira raffinosivorans]|uniref:hypothetical protein n=1 Tax=Propionispira raffinosivorans TaxID=86959 RepID=UPI000364DE95|nr:hypothetical protein [Propionispira raffinosivorans]
MLAYEEIFNKVLAPLNSWIARTVDDKYIERHTIFTTMQDCHEYHSKILSTADNNPWFSQEIYCKIYEIDEILDKGLSSASNELELVEYGENNYELLLKNTRQLSALYKKDIYELYKVDDFFNEHHFKD